MVATFLFGALIYFLAIKPAEAPQEVAELPVSVQVEPIEHASFVLELGGVTIFNDPTGTAEGYGAAEPDIILVSDIHGDHLSLATLEALATEKTVLIAPATVVSEFSSSLAAQAVTMSNGDIHEVQGILIEAVPMYNLPETAEAFHPKGRGNGYLLTKGDTRIYIAGDTADIPEMRTLEDVDIAFIPMNLPYTMPVDVAADAVLDFAPAVVYPYHYRGTAGLGDVAAFARIVKAGNPEIEVRQLDWYPEHTADVE